MDGVDSKVYCLLVHSLSGNCLYMGKFHNDKPIEEYPSGRSGRILKEQVESGFIIYKYGNGNIYCGEVKDDNNVNGVGIMFLYDEDLDKYTDAWYGEFKNSTRDGYGIAICARYFCVGGSYSLQKFERDNLVKKSIWIVGQ